MTRVRAIRQHRFMAETMTGADLSKGKPKCMVSSTMFSTGKHKFKSLIVVIIYLVLFSPIFIFPLTGGKGRIMAHEDSDIYLEVWMSDFFYQSIFVERRSPFFTDRVNWPNSGHLSPPKPVFDLVLSLWLPLVGLPAAFNIATWLFFVLGALGMYLLALRLTGSHLGAFVAGLGYGLSPFMIVYVLASAVPDLLGLFFLPFTLFFLHRSAFQPTPRNIVGGVFSLSLLWFSGLHVAAMTLTLFAFLLPAVFVLGKTGSEWLWLRRDVPDLKGNVKYPVLIVLAAILLAGLPNLFLFKTVSSSDSVVAGRFEKLAVEPPFDDYMPGDATSYYAAGLADYFRPRVKCVRECSQFSKTVFLTWGVLGLALCGLVFLRNRTATALAVLALIIMLFSTGPYLLLTENTGLHRAGNPVYLAVYYLFPLSSFFLEPFRFGQMATLFAVLLAASGAAELHRRYKTFGSIIVIIIAFVIAAETVMMARPLFTPDRLARIPSSDKVVEAAGTGGGAVVELPFFHIDDPAMFYRDRLANQTCHKRPIVDNLSGFFPDFIKTNGFLGLIAHLESPTIVPRPEQSAEDGLQALRDSNVDLVIINHCRYETKTRTLREAIVRVIDHLGLSVEKLDPCHWVILPDA